MHPDAVKPRPFYDLRQMLEGPAYYYFKKEDETDLIDVIVRVAIGKHREWIHNRNIDKNYNYIDQKKFNQIRLNNFIA